LRLVDVGVEEGDTAFSENYGLRFEI